MIVDFQADFDHARRYDIVDTATGRSMADQSIFYADDEAGIYRVYLRDARGVFRFDPFHPDEVAWEERRGTFRLVLKAQAPEPSDTRGPGRAETWRTQKPLL
jgi:hypothetical protein